MLHIDLKKKSKIRISVNPDFFPILRGIFHRKCNCGGRLKTVFDAG